MNVCVVFDLSSNFQYFVLSSKMSITDDSKVAETVGGIHECSEGVNDTFYSQSAVKSDGAYRKNNSILTQASVDEKILRPRATSFGILRNTGRGSVL